MPNSSIGLPTICGMVSRGFSDRYGFWKMYWIRLRSSTERARIPCPAAALERQLAGPLLVQAADAARDRGLAAAGLADQRHHLGLGHVEADPVHDLRTAVEDPEVLDGQDDVPVGVRVGVGGVAAVDVPGADLADAQALRGVVRADLDVLGSISRQRSWTYSQRVLNRQPTGAARPRRRARDAGERARLGQVRDRVEQRRV
jgi:hypothetical protein